MRRLRRSKVSVELDHRPERYPVSFLVLSAAFCVYLAFRLLQMAGWALEAIL
jgi:hypothetical protein